MSLDKLSLVGGGRPTLDVFLRRNDYVMTSWVNRVGIYRYTYQFVDGGILQIADPNSERNLGIPPIRVEFNPGTCMRDEVVKVLRYVKKPKLTRVDIAIDYFDVDLGELVWLDLTGRRKRAEYRSALGELETLYIGSGSSEMRFRVYDKAKEQKDRSGRIWWRVEVQLRSDCIEGNPFEQVKAVCGWSVRGESLGLIERAVLDYLRRYPHEIVRLSKASRAKYRRLMREAVECSFFSPQPAEVYEKEKARLNAELLEWLSFCSVDILPDLEYEMQSSEVVSQVVFGWNMRGGEEDGFIQV